MKKSSSLAAKVARAWRLLLAFPLALSATASPGKAAVLDFGFAETRVATGLVDPIAITHSQDGRVFIGEKGGRVRIIKNGVLLPAPFLTVPVNSQGDRGLFALALDPNREVPEQVYVYYTATTPTIHNRVSRFTVSPSNPDTVVAGSELVLLDLPPLTSLFNNGGGLVFDGTNLTLSTGDDGIPANAQSLNNPFGKILRITGMGEIPATNPFFSQTTGINRAIWALGFRNPFPLTQLYGADSFVSHDMGTKSAEKNIVVAGGNYGWPICDGSCASGGFVNPVDEGNVNPGNLCQPKGAVLYLRPLFGSDCGGLDYFNAYFFTNCDNIGVTFSNGFFRSFAENAAGEITGLDVDSTGQLWYIERGTGSAYRVFVDSPCSTPPIITVQPQPQNQTVAEGTRVTLSVQATANPGCYLSYRWYFIESDDGPTPIPGATNPTYTFTAQRGVTYKVVVSNLAGSVSSNEVFVDSIVPQPPFEAENLAVENSSGEPIHFIRETLASGEAGRSIDSNGVNDQITFRLPNVVLGKYTVKVRFKKQADRATIQTSTGKVGGTLSNVGPVIDLYSSQPTFEEVTIGTWTVQSTSDKLVRFQVTGKNAASLGFTIYIDSIRLIPQ